MYLSLLRWYFLGSECSDEDENWRQMKLQKLSEKGEFCCRNGLCINSEHRCDNSIDCVDHSDEENCEVVTFPFQYNADSPPAPVRMKRFPTLNTDYSTRVNVSVDLFNIFDINEVTSEFSMIFQIYLEWKDPRLKFFYLNGDIEKNIIDKDVWIPKLVFANQKQYISEYRAKLKVKKQGVPKLNAYENVNMEEMYEGSENTIILREMFQMKFICSFSNIDDFPFDLEHCYINILNTNGEIVSLVPLDIQYFGSMSIAQYTIKDISIRNQSFEGIGSGIQISITLGRDFMSIFSVTYLPTILMNIINQSTNYLDNSQFLEAIITVNITCMMVLSALYISVSNSLPTTSNIKYIDIWLLFSLIFPFVIILLNILLYQGKHRKIHVKKVHSMFKPGTQSKVASQDRFLLKYFLQCFLLYINPILYVIFVIFHLFYGTFGM